MRRKLSLLLLLIPLLAAGRSFKVQNSAICYDQQEAKQVVRAIADLQDDFKRVTGQRAIISAGDSRNAQIIIGTYGKSKLISQLVKKGLVKENDLKGKWESYVITVTDEKTPRLVIAGSDTRGTIYGIYDVSKRIGVSPWYWWADVPVEKNPDVKIDCDYFASGEPTVKYRGIFINDEDWGLKPWAEKNYEKELGDIGPKTYARVCELLLRLKANMLAPAMHSCTGAFYSHPESKVVCDSFGIIITTSHCEPLLLNNAAESEWNSKRDGEWNYKTNRKTILKKWDDRLTEASQYENIYTVAMRGVHDEGLKGDLPMKERVPLVDTVIMDQRQLLERHIGKKATDIPQIFVPYKETMDIYENGLQVSDDITLVWVDDNYGYLKRVSNPDEQKRSGRAGVYYHLSYLGAPHDYLWINTTPPVLMYEELKKAYDTGADRYWLLNVGDIKPMELGIQTFMDMAWDIHDFSFERARTYQARILTQLFDLSSSISRLQPLLDAYYRLAWSRKPEYMGWEYEWDDRAHMGLKSTEFSFQHYGEAQQRLSDYQQISDEIERLALNPSVCKNPQMSAAFFQLVQFPIQAAYQMNRKFLMAQLNQELLAQGHTAEANWAARQTEQAYDSINALNHRYNEQLDGKWRYMMDLSTSFTPTCQFYQKPDVVYTEGEDMKPVDLTPQQEVLEGCAVLELSNYCSKGNDVQLVQGLGYDDQVVQLGNPTSSIAHQTSTITYSLPRINSDQIDVVVYTVPFWPLYAGKSNAISISVDNSEPQVFENRFEEYSRTWKDQVMRNGAVCKLRFNVDKTNASHTIRFSAIDPGQMLQRVIIDWGGLKPSYLGPNFASKE